MYRRQSESMPPLGLWAMLGVATILIFLATYHFIVREKEKDFHSRVAYIQDKTKKAGNKPVVLILGTSLSEYGLDSTIEMENQVASVSGKRPVIIKIWKPAIQVNQMVDNLEYLVTNPPQLLVIEANMFCYAPRITLLNQTLRAFYSAFRFEPLHEPYFPDKTPEASTSKTGNLADFRDKTVDTLQLISFRKWANRLQSSGTKVLLVNFPIEKQEEIKKWNSRDTTAFNQNIRFLQQQLRFSYFKPSCYIDSTAFIDKAHMNKKGSKLFTSMICNAIAKAL
ncbi:MAG TPA: hypothetical protein VJ499_09525 [Flavisolibacter sp.]|nr:hypothetical protein [Flavisolibacter sp.]